MQFDKWAQEIVKAGQEVTKKATKIGSSLRELGVQVKSEVNLILKFVKFVLYGVKKNFKTKIVEHALQKMSVEKFDCGTQTTGRNRVEQPYIYTLHIGNIPDSVALRPDLCKQ